MFFFFFFLYSETAIKRWGKRKQKENRKQERLYRKVIERLYNLLAESTEPNLLERASETYLCPSFNSLYLHGVWKSYSQRFGDMIGTKRIFNITRQTTNETSNKKHRDNYYLHLYYFYINLLQNESDQLWYSFPKEDFFS